MDFEKIAQPTPGELFIRQIEGKIISGELPVGMKLPTERELAAETGVTKSVAHFALKELENMGFVRIEPRRGAYVADFARKGNFNTLNELLKYRGARVEDHLTTSLVELRNAIEGGALIKLGKTGTADDYAALQGLIDELKELNDAGRADDAVTADLTIRFHYAVCELSGNDMFPLVMNAFEGIAAVLWRRCVNYWHAPSVISHEQHMLDLISAGQGHKAARYIEDVFDDFLVHNGGKPY